MDDVFKIITKSIEKFMPEDMDVPTEGLQDEIKEKAEKGGEGWMIGVALTSALLAVLAAICSLLAGHQANEALIDQIKSNDEWNYYQAKGIKSSVLETKTDILQSQGKAPDIKDIEKINEYRQQQKEIDRKASELGESSEKHLKIHNTLASGVTLFQIAIAISAISALTKKRLLWYISILLGISGLMYFLIGLIMH